MTQIKQKVTTRPQLMTKAPITYCPGCHYGIVTRLLAEVLEELGIGGTCIGLVGPSCSASLQWNIYIDWMSAAHGRAPASATGIKRVRPECTVFTVQGDGDLVSIGLGNFMHAMLRGEKLTTIFLNNACFGQTGGQMAPTTLIGMRTTTTPLGRDERKHGYPLHVAELAASMKGVAYSARYSFNSPANYRKARKAIKAAFQKQLDGIGYGFVELLCPCPTNWGMTPLDALKFIEERMIPEYPLGEFKNVDSLDAEVKNG
ncbi:MAG: thiamine pyrophosphate-dependent enzyme [Dehalococcoidia bacterium]